MTLRNCLKYVRYLCDTGDPKGTTFFTTLRKTKTKPVRVLVACMQAMCATSLAPVSIACGMLFEIVGEV
jgi:hypothetical protein